MIRTQNIGVIANTDQVTVSFTISGTLSSTLTNVTYSLTIPTGLSHVSETLSTGTYDNGTGKWTVPSQASGDTITGDFVLQIDDATIQDYDVILELDRGFVADSKLSDNKLTVKLQGVTDLTP